MIELRTVESDVDVVAWAELKSTVVPNEPVTPEQVRSSDEPGRVLLLAERDGVLAGCGIGAPSHFAGRAFIAVRVLAEHRRQGVGTALGRALADHARALGRDGVSAFVYDDEPHSVAFAEWFGLVQADYQLEQIRLVGDETPPVIPGGVELVSLEERRDEWLNAVWAVALQGYADMPVPGEIAYSLAEWLREEATRPGGSFVALAAGVPVGYAGLMVHAGGAATAEHGLTVVDREHRGRGIARALKQAQLLWAAENGVARLVTWTQKGNEAMQALNRSLGYVDKSRVITFQGPLP